MIDAHTHTEGQRNTCTCYGHEAVAGTRRTSQTGKRSWVLLTLSPDADCGNEVSWLWLSSECKAPSQRVLSPVSAVRLTRQVTPPNTWSRDTHGV